MLEKQQENEKPRYDRTLLQGQQDESLKILKKRANFGEHYGKEPEVETFEWNGLRIVREAMREAVPEIPTTEFKLTGDKVGQTIRNCRQPAY